MAGFAIWLLARRRRRAAVTGTPGQFDFSQTTTGALIALLSEDL